jgi:glycosyltransferase involved in cell wall biosynthesis
MLEVVSEPREPTRNFSSARPVCFSLGIMAWNEERSIGAALISLFQQSVFTWLASRGEKAEIIVLPNGCTDCTGTVAEETMERARRGHPHPEAFAARVIELEQPGRNNAWNRFVHDFSAREARMIFLMDADIVFHGHDTLRNMVLALERNREAMVVTDRAHKEIEFKPSKSLRDRLSLATSRMNRTSEACFSGQLYGMRAEVARNLFIPRDLGAAEDGFFKQMVCTDFLTGPVNTRRVVLAPEAAHVFEAYVSPREVLKNQQRQMIGQTAVHVLVEYLKGRPEAERRQLADTLKREEWRDPDWLKKLLSRHLSRTRFFWQLFPGLAGFRLKRWAQLRGWQRIVNFPAALLGTGVTLWSCWRAFRFMRAGNTYYWPKADRGSLLHAHPESP